MPVEIGTGTGRQYSRLERGRRWELVLKAIEINLVKKTSETLHEPGYGHFIEKKKNPGISLNRCFNPAFCIKADNYKAAFAHRVCMHTESECRPPPEKGGGM